MKTFRFKVFTDMGDYTDIYAADAEQAMRIVERMLCYRVKPYAAVRCDFC